MFLLPSPSPSHLYPTPSISYLARVLPPSLLPRCLPGEAPWLGGRRRRRRRRCKSKSSPGGRILPVCEGLSHRPQLFSLSLFSRCFCLHFFVTLASCMREREREREPLHERKGTTPVKADKSKEATLLDTFSATPIGAGKCLHAACIFPCATLSPPFLRRCFFAISRLCSVSAAVALKEEATRNKRSPPWPPLRSPGAEEEEDDDGKVFDCLSSYNGGLCKGAKTSQKPEKVQIRRQGIVSCSVFQGKMKVLLPKRNRIYSIGYAITAWNQSSLLAGNVFCPRQS